MGSSKEKYKSRPGDMERCKNMTTKGAGAGGARPLCGGGRKPPSCFCIFSVSLCLDLYFSLYLRALICGIPSANFWKETTCLKKAFRGFAPLFVLGFKLHGEHLRRLPESENPILLAATILSEPYPPRVSPNPDFPPM